MVCEELGKWVHRATAALVQVGWNRTCDVMRGRSDLHPDIGSLPHKAAPLLDRIRRNGAPAVMQSAPWTAELLDERMERGCHQSAHGSEEFVMEEFLDFCQKGFWMVLPYECVRDLPGLRLSPLGVVPQRERRDRLIVDYSYYDVNTSTLPLAPPEAMQFGKATHRLLQTAQWANPVHGPVYGYKVDIGDGFYRIPLTASASLRLGVTLPQPTSGEQWVAFPLTLPMGWRESPPFFCAFTETACDLANEDLRHRRRVPTHPLAGRAGVGDFAPNPDTGSDSLPATPIPSSHRPLLQRAPLAYLDVYVDDFCGLGQDHPSNPLQNQRNVLLHRIDQVFRPSDAQDSAIRKEPISTKKLDKQDASWQTVKRKLGWDFALRSRRLLIPPHRREKVLADLRDTLGKRRVSLKVFQSVVGQLQSLVQGLPGSRGQFSLLYDAITKHDGDRVRITPSVRNQLQTFVDLLTDEALPPSFAELVPGVPIHIGACDAAQAGMGGVWFPEKGPPLVWRHAFPPYVQRELVSYANPSGTITNSDLELAGTISHQSVLSDNYDVAGETTHTFCDNTPAVAWQEKGSSTTTKHRAYLLRLAALRQRRTRVHARIQHLAGKRNVMADDASRLFHLSDAEFLQLFNSRYPQEQSWRLCPPKADNVSQVISMLSDSTSMRESVLNDRSWQSPCGISGSVSASTSASTPSFPTSPTLSPSSSSLAPASVLATTDPLEPPITRTALDMLRTPYVRWARHFPQWV